MKLAGIHCRIAKWWALDVFKELLKEELSSQNFSEIKIFSTYSELETLQISNKQIKIITALPKRLNMFFQRNSRKNIPILKQLFDYRNLMFFYPLLMKILSWKIQQYKPNKILISSFAIAKNIEQCKTQKHWTHLTSSTKILTQNITLYLHSPMQYIRSHKQEYTKKLTGRKGRIFRKIIPKLQQRDLQYTNYNKVYANSTYTKTLAKEIYTIESEVKYPKIHQNYFYEKIVEQPKEYIVCTGRVVKFVREIDSIIKAFNTIGYPLIIIWSGPDEKALKKLAKKNITFTGRNPPNMIDIIKNAKGSINLTKESFGLSTAESLCLWVPVLGYNQGATPEIIDKNSWILIENKTEQEIINQFKKFISHQRDRKQIASRARLLFTSKQD